LYEWWNCHFHTSFPRPDVIDDEALDQVYLARKRFLFDEFGEFGLGKEHPVMDGHYVNMVLKYGMDLIPYLYGAALTCQEAGGWMPVPFSKEELSRMEPVDIGAHPFAQWLLDEWERKIKRYGSAKAFLDYESPVNIAVRLRGEDFYMDMIDDPDFTDHVLDLSTSAIEYIFKFQDRFLSTAEEREASIFSIGNCNVTMMSQEHYVERIKPFDIRLINKIEELTGRQWKMLLHHCDVPADRFIKAYRDLPRLTALQASHSTDIPAVFAGMPGVSFLAMISPGEMKLPPDKLNAIIERAVELGSAELDLWNIDPSVSPEKLRALFAFIRRTCENRGKIPVFNAIPFVWDELEWAYPRYQGGKQAASLV
jgi:hypothetical protein